MTYIETNELNYELNERDFTAKVVFSENSCNDVLIPYSITHLNYVYVITCIGKESFHRNESYIKSKCLHHQILMHVNMFILK